MQDEFELQDEELEFLPVNALSIIVWIFMLFWGLVAWGFISLLKAVF